MNQDGYFWTYKVNNQVIQPVRSSTPTPWLKGTLVEFLESGLEYPPFFSGDELPEIVKIVPDGFHEHNQEFLPIYRVVRNSMKFVNSRISMRKSRRLRRAFCHLRQMRRIVIQSKNWDLMIKTSLIRIQKIKRKIIIKGEVP